VVRCGEWSGVGSGPVWGVVRCGEWSGMGSGPVWGVVRCGEWPDVGSGPVWGMVVVVMVVGGWVVGGGWRWTWR